jgi:antagonist of KipI
MNVRVLKLRGSCHLQDAGRVGQAQFGMPKGGFADHTSASLANLILGKRSGATLLECTMGGPDLFFESTCLLAITGADIQPRINGVRIPMWERIRVSKGSKLTSTRAEFGLRTYLAFGESLVASAWRDSVSPVLIGGDLHPSHSVLMEGDELRFTGEEVSFSERIARAYVELPQHVCLLEKDSKIRLKLFKAPESHLVEADEERRVEFENSVWQISPQSNRMGIRLVGPSLSLGKTTSSMRSGPVLPGTVQLLPDGQLIVTHVDGQTIGGYPRIGIVDAMGMDVLAQAAAGRVEVWFCF